MKEGKISATRKRDWILAAVLLGAAAIFYLAGRLGASPAAYARIEINGVLVETVDLAEDRTFSVAGYNGGTNEIQVEKGKISVISATCPDKVCVNRGWAEHTGDTIVCLPNRMIIQIMAGNISDP